MSPSARQPRWLEDLQRIDAATYAAIADTPTPTLDRALSRLSRAADYSRLWLGSGALLALLAGPEGRCAAALGLGSVGVTATVVNLVIKPLGRRRRPDREAVGVSSIRHVPAPTSSSFPSGHSAVAFAFATGVGHTLPHVAVPIRALAALVAYSRVHTGVHYPGDVLVGALLGTAIAETCLPLLKPLGAMIRAVRVDQRDRGSTVTVDHPFRMMRRRPRQGMMPAAMRTPSPSMCVISNAWVAMYGLAGVGLGAAWAQSSF